MKLNDQQRQAATYDLNSDLLVLAGAGTGKTKTIIARATYLIKSGVPANRIVLITFTRRAASEVMKRLIKELGEASEGVFTGTFHKFCLSIMKTIPKSFEVHARTIIDKDDQLALMRISRSFIIPKSMKKFPQAGALVKLLSYARNTNRPIKEHMEKYSGLDEDSILKSIKIFNVYQNKKRESGYLDFDDILYFFVTALAKNEKLKNKLKALFSHILVDEMQDTNPIQWLILESIRGPAKLFCVGDDAQSIYAFRGADFKNIHSFCERVKDAVILKLEKNYRSTQEILDMSNWLIGDSPLKYEKFLESARGKGIVPRIIDFNNRFSEARWIVSDLFKRHLKGAPFKDHMILVRSAYLSRTLEGMLIERNIPYRFIGGQSLMEATHVKDLICMARAAGNPSDEIAWIRYLKCWPRIGDVRASKIVEAIVNAKNSLEAFDCIDEVLGDRLEITTGLRLMVPHFDNPAAALEYGINTLSGLMEKKYDRWRMRKKDLELLVKMAKKFNSLSDFIETYTLDPISSTQSQLASTKDAVTIITIHSAKGTEEAVCYIIQAKQGVFPHVKSQGSLADNEEERRVLYVAMTRAKNELIITRPQDNGFNTYMNFSGAAGDDQDIPYFLSDIPPYLFSKETHGLQSENNSFLYELEDEY